MKILRCVPLLFALISSAGEPVLFIPLDRDTPIAKLVALAKRPEQTKSRTGYDEIRCEALRLLAERPPGAPDREKVIKDTLIAALAAEQSQVRNTGAAALGKRGYRSEIGTLFSKLEADPEPIVHFYRALESPREDPPVELLRKGLESPNAAARAAAAEVAGLCGAKTLTNEMKRLIDSDTNPAVRDQAAIALALLGAEDSREALLRLRTRGYKSLSLARALLELGGDEQVKGLLPLLWDKDPQMRKLVAEGLGKMRLEDREAATLSLLVALRDSSPEVRIASAQALAGFREARAIPILRETLPEARDYSVEARTALVEAVAAFGEELSIPLLNDMLSWRFRQDCGLEETLAKLGHPSSGNAAWSAYVEDLEKWSTRRYLVDEYATALPVITACADADLMTSIRETAATATNPEVKGRLESVAKTVAERLAKGVVVHRPLPQAPVAVPLPDSDGDGEPDVRDKYPKDPRRVTDIPEFVMKFAEKRMAAIPLRMFAPDTPAPQLLTIDDDDRVGYLVAETQDDAPVFRVVSTDGFAMRREWILPNPGNLAGIEKLIPTSMNAQGTVVGTAIWKTEAIAKDATGKDNRLPPACGFVFKNGKLTLSAAPPFSATTMRSVFKKVNQRGEIFGHREEQTGDPIGAQIRTVAFLGDHVFRDMPPFEVTTITKYGSLLCYREAADGRESFIWDRASFIPIDRFRGLRVPVRAAGMNAKLQVVGNYETVNQGGAFFWENRKLLPLTGKIPDEQGFWMKSMTPLMISDSGSIILAANLMDDGGNPDEKLHFELILRETGKNEFHRLRFD